MISHLKEEAFQRPPTEEEVRLGKREGVRGLFDIVRNRYKKKVHGPEQGEPSKVQKAKVQKVKGRKQKPHEQSSRDSDEDSAHTSSDEDEEDGSTEKSGESSSSGTTESSSEGSDNEEECDNNISKDVRNIEEAEDGEGSSSDNATSDHDE